MSGNAITVGRGRWDTLRIVLRDIGSLQVVMGLAMLLPCVVSILYGEIHSAASFLLASAITGSAGLFASRVFSNAGEPERYHAMLVAGAGWLVTACFGALPFVIAAFLTPATVAQSFVPAGASYASSLVYFRNPLHALFESMSAFTTTGLTMAVHEPENRGTTHGGS